MNIDAYAARIGVSLQELSPNADSLRLLQREHLLSVPFENLDIHRKRPIVLETARFYDKIVVEHRGGFCYELNGLFIELLKAVGFQSRLISARVFNGTDHGPEFDHAAIIVTIGDDEFLTDVGFGDFTAEPLRFVLEEEQTDDTGTFVIKQFDTEYFDIAKRDGDGWKSQYIFKDIARDLSEFTKMCDFQQNSPDSHFTKGKVCSVLTNNGRKTLTDHKFVITSYGRREETEVLTASDFDRLLAHEFSIRRLQYN